MAISLQLMHGEVDLGALDRDLQDLEHVINVGKIDELQLVPKDPTSFSSGTPTGYLYYDEELNVPRYWDGAQFINIGGTPSGDDDDPGPFDLSNYLYKPGLAGGQTAYGGIGAEDHLRLGANTASGGGGVLRFFGRPGATTIAEFWALLGSGVRTRVYSTGQWEFSSSSSAPVLLVLGSNSVQIGSTTSFTNLTINPSSTDVSFILTKPTGSLPTHAAVRFFTTSATPVSMSLAGHLIVSRATGQGLIDPTIQARVQTNQTGQALDIYHNSIELKLAGVDAGGDLYGQGLELWDGINATRILTQRYASGGSSYQLTWPASAPAANDSLALFSTAGVIQYSTTLPPESLPKNIKPDTVSFPEIATPDDPPTDCGTLFARASGANIQLIFKSSTGAECVICTLVDTVHVNELQFNLIEP
jgi:hypothetical protein